jgi:hypothetical protein
VVKVEIDLELLEPAAPSKKSPMDVVAWIERAELRDRAAPPPT